MEFPLQKRLHHSVFSPVTTPIIVSRIIYFPVDLSLTTANRSYQSNSFVSTTEQESMNLHSWYIKYKFF